MGYGDGSEKFVNIPPPPPLPKYDPKEDAPMWSFSRYRYNLPVDKGPKPWTPIGTQPKSPDDPDWRGVVRNNVIEFPMPGPYKYGYHNSPKYFWFDTPDYADPFKKLWYSFKWFVGTGLFLTSVRGTLFHLPEGMPYFQAHVHVLSRTFVPYLLAGVAASTAVVTIANLRGKKDDYYNYLFGGLLMGSILGRKNHVMFVRYVILTVPAALFVKYNAEINGDIFPRFNHWQFNTSLSGQSADHGIFSGDLRFGIRGNHGDPGRDVRRPW